MRLDEFQLADGNYFVAMEYYAGVLNRTYLVLMTAESIIGLVVHGMIASKDRGDPLTRLITSKFSPGGNLSNPMSYVDEKYRRKYRDVDLKDGDLKRISSANFRSALSEITDVYHDPTKKRGMGPYPHDGKVYMTFGKSKREFIILGDQSGEKIVNAVKNRLPPPLD